MRGALVVALVGACGFEHGALGPADSSMPDVRPDTIVPTWAVDGMSMKGLPANTSEWMQLVSAYNLSTKPPDDLWLMDTANGPLDDVIGTFPLMPQNGPTYDNPVAGWSRHAVGTVDTAGNQGFITGATGNLNGTSYLLLLYTSVVVPPTSDRSIAGIGAGPDHRFVAVTMNPFFKATGAAVTASTGTVNAQTAVHPVVMKINASAMQYVVYTDQEKLQPTWLGTSGTGPLLMIGNATIGTASARYLYGALWSGTKAEMSDAEVKKLLQSLGWTVTGY